jgi:predicted homoserine dehydrogenase-like protein
MSFVAVMIQEALSGKGVIQSIADGDPFFIICLVLTVASIGGVTVLLALKGTDDYVDNDLRQK